ncbi:MAG: ABC transporter substrate-binding protein [Saccharofermentanales bacterium]|jgi:peptide/nickel transport system substrate-binding protein
MNTMQALAEINTLLEVKNEKKFLALVVTVVLVLSITACSSSPSTGGQPTTPDTSSSAAPISHTLIVGQTGAVEGFDPGSSNNGIGFYLVYDTVFYKDPYSDEFKSNVIDTYHWVDDTTLQLNLKRGVKFSNGDELTAKDILFSMKYYVDSGSNLASFYTQYDFANSTAKDDYTLLIKYNSVFGPAISYLTETKIQNQKYFETNGAEAFWDRPCGTGPYTCAENVTGAYTKYTLRDDYWGGMKPEATEITVRSYSEPSTMYIDYQNGALDMAVGVGSLDADRAINEKLQNTVIKNQSNNDVLMFCFNNTVKLFDDVNVRKAIASAVDWNACAKAAYGVLCQPATSTLPSNFKYHVDTGGFKYDPDLAKQLLSIAGYENGFEIQLVIPNIIETQRLAEAIQGYLKAVNIKLTINAYALPTAVGMFMKGETDVSIKMIPGGAKNFEAHQVYEGLTATSTNISVSIKDATLNSYFTTGLGTNIDSERQENYTKAQQWLFDNYQALPICEPSTCLIFKDSISLTTNLTSFPDLTYVHFN